MILSDGSTSIHYKSNSCSLHHDRKGENLCVHCGKWFCDECMSITHKYLCENCAAEVKKSAPVRQNEDKELNRRRALTPLIFAAAIALVAVLGKLRIGLIAIPLAFLVWSMGNRKKRKKPMEKHKANGTVTEEQVTTLLRLFGGKVTAAKLAKAAGVKEAAAKKLLNRMTVDGKLNVEADVEELLYTKI